MRTVYIALAAVAAAGAVQAASIRVDHGNIVVNGRTVTHSAHDGDPVLAPDGKRVVFVRDLGGKAMTDCAGDASELKPSELWEANVDGSGAHRLLAVHANQDVRLTVCMFGSPQFSSDGRFLYFQTAAWATSGAVHVYDFKTGKEHFVVDGDGLSVIAKCDNPEYRDDLIVTRHKYFVFGGSYDWSWLVSPTGKEVGPVGGDDAKIGEIVKEACS